MWARILGQALAGLFKKKQSPDASPAASTTSILETKFDTTKVTIPSTPPPVATPTSQPSPFPPPVVAKKHTPLAKTREAAKQRYGEIVEQNGKLVWQEEAKWMAMFKVPSGFERWMNSASRRPVTQIYCNKDMHAPLQQALQNLLDRNLVSELKTFDGCFQLRMVRGTTSSLSTHSYGLAIDVNAAENGLNVEPKLSPEFVKCWTDAGFSWGGSFRRKDGMHFSWAWE